MVFTVGITGGIACGKTTVANYFAQQHIDIVDADIIAREVVEPHTPALAAIHAHFGDAILTGEGKLHRKKLRAIIFNEPPQKKWLENLLHPLIRQKIITRLQKVTSAYAMLVSPLLIETDQHLLVNRLLVVDAPKDVQIERTQQRDHCSTEQAEAIIKTQLSREKRIKRADDLVYNNTSLKTLYAQLHMLHQKYLKMA